MCVVCDVYHQHVSRLASCVRVDVVHVSMHNDDEQRRRTTSTPSALVAWFSRRYVQVHHLLSTCGEFGARACQERVQHARERVAPTVSECFSVGRRQQHTSVRSNRECTRVWLQRCSMHAMPCHAMPCHAMRCAWLDVGRYCRTVRTGQRVSCRVAIWFLCSCFKMVSR